MNDMTYSINTTTSTSRSGLVVLVGKKNTIIVSVKFGERRENSRTNGTIQANRKTLRCEQQFNVFFSNHELDNLAQNGNHAGMVNTYPFL